MSGQMAPDLRLLNDGLPYARLCEQLQHDGWEEIGRSEWAWVFGHPRCDLAIRVTPLDPAFRLFAERVLGAGGVPGFAWIDAIHELSGSGYAVVMERLQPVPMPEAKRFCAEVESDERQGMREFLVALTDEGKRRWASFGGWDSNPRNVMSRDDGELVITDPVYLDGIALRQALENSDHSAFEGLSAEELTAFCDTPQFGSGGEGKRALVLALLKDIRG